MAKEFELDDKGNIVKPSKTKVLITSYSSGIPIFCPKCDSDRIVIFFGHNFTPRLVGDWQEKIHNRQAVLCDKFEIIQKFTPKNQVTSLSNPNWVCKQCYNGGIIMRKNDRNQIFDKLEKTAESLESHKDDFFNTEDIVWQKIQKQFEENQKNFSENSPPFYLDENGDEISLKEIFDVESINSKPVCLIAVTRHQYDISQFPSFEKYVKDQLRYTRIYYGLWPNKEENKIEYDVLYVIPTNDSAQIQRHLNLHNDLNGGVSQEMGLVIFSDGSFEIVCNSK